MIRLLQVLWVVTCLAFAAYAGFWISAHGYWHIVGICAVLAIPVLAFQWFEDAVLKWPEARWMKWASRAATLVLVVLFSAGFAGIAFDWIYG